MGSLWKPEEEASVLPASERFGSFWNVKVPAARNSSAVVFSLQFLNHVFQLSSQTTRWNCSHVLVRRVIKPPDFNLFLLKLMWRRKSWKRKASPLSSLSVSFTAAQQPIKVWLLSGAEPREAHTHQNLILLNRLFGELRDYRLIMTHNPRRGRRCGLTALKPRVDGWFEGWSRLPAASRGNRLTGFNHTRQPIQLCS